MKGCTRKVFAVLAAAVMSASLFAGCGNSQQTSSAGNTSAASPQSNGGQTYTLKVLGPETTNQFVKFADREKYHVWQIFEQKMKDAGLSMEYEIVPNDQYQIIIQTRMASANDLPDFANISPLDTTTAMSLAKQGILISVNGILEKSDGTARAFYEEEIPFVKGAATASDGNMYWITTAQKTTYEDKPGSTCQMIAIRQDWLDKLDLSVPTNAEEFVSVMKAFRDQDVNGSGVADEILAFDPSWFNNGIAQWFGLGTQNTSINLTEQKVVSPWYQDGIKEYFQYMNRLVNEGILDTSLIGATTSDMQNQKMAENKVGATFTYAMQAWLEPSVNADTEVYYQPVGPLPAVDGIEPASAIEPANLVTNRWAFTKACTDLEAAARLMDILYSDDAQVLETWGVEGETYEMVNGEKRYLENIDNAHWEDCAKNGTVKGDWLWGDSVFPKLRFVPMEIEIEERGGGKAEYQKKVIFHDPRFPTGNDSYFAVPTDEQLAKKAEISTDLDTYSRELATQLILGQKSLDDWDTYIGELKELGLDTLLEIDTDLYNRFLAAQK